MTEPEAEGQAHVPPGPEVSVIVPTFNERENVTELIACVQAALDGTRWELIFVDDDSPDDTARATGQRIGPKGQQDPMYSAHRSQGPFNSGYRRHARQLRALSRRHRW